MNRTHSLRLSAALFATTLVVFAARTESAQADVRIRARIETPNLSVEVGHQDRHLPPPVRVVRHVEPRYEPSCDYREPISTYDRRVAANLARMSGISRHVLLSERADGWSWKEIARRHGLSRRELRAAQEHAEYAFHDRPGKHGRRHGR